MSYDLLIKNGTVVDGTGSPLKSESGCMRIMIRSACKPDASEVSLENQRDREKRFKSPDSFWAIGGPNCMQLRRSIVGQL